MSDKLPTIDELRKDKTLEYPEKLDALNVLLNQPPPEEWLKRHPYAKDVIYIPIARVEWLLIRIYKKYRVRIKSVIFIANSPVVTVRVYVPDPLKAGEWDWHDGVGAAPIITDKEAGAIDFHNMVTSGVMTSAPAAETFAIKDAAEKFGKIFGRDLNRKDHYSYGGLPPKKLDDDDLITRELRNTLEENLRQSVVDEADKLALEARIPGMTFKEYKLAVDWLRANTMDPITTGSNANMGQVHAKLEQKVGPKVSREDGKRITKKIKEASKTP